jgi:tetratricopeptide (TPR) repeat protein
VDEFEAYYDASNAIFWYTRDTFLYRLLNKALREQDIDTLYSLRYFIKDLHIQLKERHISQQREVSAAAAVTISAVPATRTETVYRGQLMFNDEFDKKIRDNINGYFSVNTFLSTTTIKDLAIIYAGRDDHCIGAEQSVLFHIDIDKTVNKFPYANISKQSAFEDDEEEILFTMGAVFRIQSVNLDKEGVWSIYLKLTGEEDEELRVLSEHMRTDIFLGNPSYSLAKLLYTLANYNAAEQYYLLVLTNSEVTDDLRSIVYNDLGSVHRQLGQYAKAIEYCEKSLEVEICIKHLSPSDSRLASIYTNMGLIYNNQDKYQEALVYYNKGVQMHQKQSAPTSRDRRRLAVSYNNIGEIYHKQRCYSKALEMFEKCLKIELEVLPPAHAEFGTYYNNIAGVYYQLQQYDKAVEYFKKALEIMVISLPSNHLMLATVYNNLGAAFKKINKMNEAVDMFEKCLAIELKSNPSSQSSAADLYGTIGTIYYGLHNYDKTIECWNRTLEIFINSLPPNHPDLAIAYHNLSLAFYDQGKLQEALEYRKKAYEIRLKIFPLDDPQLTIDKRSIAVVEDFMRRTPH